MSRNNPKSSRTWNLLQADKDRHFISKPACQRFFYNKPGRKSISSKTSRKGIFSPKPREAGRHLLIVSVYVFIGVGGGCGDCLIPISLTQVVSKSHIHLEMVMDGVI